MGRLFVGDGSTGIEAEDRIVISLGTALTEYLEGRLIALVVSEFLNEYGVTTRSTLIGTPQSLHHFWVEVDDENVETDLEYAQCALECAETMLGFIVLDAHDEVVADPATRKKVIRRSLESQSQSAS